MEQLKTILQKLPVSSTTAREYESVILTKEEENAALLEAKTKKYWQLQELQERESRLKKFTELTRLWTIDEMTDAALQRANTLAKMSGHPCYLLDEFTNPVFKLLCRYFTGDPEFEQNGRSLKKGILLVGNVGVGKTDLLRAFEFNRVQCFQTITCGEISAMVKENGADYWTTYTGFIPGHGGTDKYFLQPNIGWLFDDLGTEDPVNDFGTKVDPLSLIILERYKMKDKQPFNTLHITTNMNGDMIQNRYDARIRSRIREMFNVIQLAGSDRRV